MFACPRAKAARRPPIRRAGSCRVLFVCVFVGLFVCLFVCRCGAQLVFCWFLFCLPAQLNFLWAQLRSGGVRAAFGAQNELLECLIERGKTLDECAGTAGLESTDPAVAELATIAKEALEMHGMNRAAVGVAEFIIEALC